MAPTTDDRTQQWVLAGRLVTVAFLGGIVAFALTGAALWIGFVVIIPLVMAGGWAMDPRRPWWGSGPMAVMTDPELRRQWRRSEVRFGIVAFILIVVILPAVLVFSGIAPR
jgi:hypothetical protein